jgi:prepilin-type N-terminal cleavage/methylation domain-containing protein
MNMRQLAIGNRQSSSRAFTRRRPLVSLHRGFTLVELLIAIVVLLAVILALSRIFSTATDVTSIGRASASILQEAAVIESRMREDIANISADGFFAIRQVAIRNDVHVPNGGPLLDHTRPPHAYIRADQLVFITENAQNFEMTRIGEALNLMAQAPAARVYWGHAVQFPDGPAFEVGSPSNRGNAFDPASLPGQQPLVPWRRGPIDMERTWFDRATQAPGGVFGTSIYSRSAGVTIDGTQPSVQRWLLARHAALLADSSPPADGPNINRKTRFGAEGTGTGPGGFAGAVPLARSIFSDTAYADGWHPRYGWSRELRNGRVAGAASTPSEIRRWIRTNPIEFGLPEFFRPWTDFDNDYIGIGGDQRTLIAREAIYYPRGERRAPSMIRVDQALTNHIIGTAVSDIVIEWTWDDGTGDLHDEQGNLLLYQFDNVAGEYLIRSEKELRGPVVFNEESAWWPFGFYTNWYDPNTSTLYSYQPEQPWFGLNERWFCDTDPCPPDRGVGFYSDAPFNDSGYQNSYQFRANYKPADTIFPNLSTIVFPQSGTYNDDQWSTIEWWGNATAFANRHPNSELARWADYGDRVLIYEATFGYNHDTPVRETVGGMNDLNGNTISQMIDPYLGYTPWPSAIRVTMTLHDPQGRMESGRQVQFVIELPRRTRTGSE